MCVGGGGEEERAEGRGEEERGTRWKGKVRQRKQKKKQYFLPIWTLSIEKYCFNVK